MSERKTTFSEDRRYRYVLWRSWDDWLLQDHSQPKKGFVQFIGLNPSTADETKDDPTLRRCIGFAKSWGYGALCMTNLFAFRETDPRKMLMQADPVGPENDSWLLHIAVQADLIVAAWGTKGHAFYRDDAVLKWLGPKLHCLRKTSEGHPEHPLYLPKTLTPVPYPKI